jgi:hypothetical protein
MVGSANNSENKQQKQKFKFLRYDGHIIPSKECTFIWLMVQNTGKLVAVARNRKN